VHKLRNILRKAPQHAHDEVTDDYHLIVYATGLAAAVAAREAFVKKWSKRCPGAVESLNEAGDELLTFYSFPKEQWEDHPHDERDRTDQRGIPPSREDPKAHSRRRAARSSCSTASSPAARSTCAASTATRSSSTSFLARRTPPHNESCYTTPTKHPEEAPSPISTSSGTRPRFSRYSRGSERSGLGGIRDA
jgi:hypothetical protein